MGVRLELPELHGSGDDRSNLKESTSSGGGALFVLNTSLRYPGPVAVWILAAGWAGAAERRWGNAWICTPEGIMTSEEALVLATGVRATRRRAPRKLPFTGTINVFRKDVVTALRAFQFRDAAVGGPWHGHRLQFVWQYHSLFQRAGFVAARHYGVPLVLFVDAPIVWEGDRWGVRRPGWGGILERAGELPQLRAADIVACVSAEVAEVVHARGVPSDRIIVTPCRVDLDRFHPNVSAARVRERFALNGKFVVGLTGSFRRFHGVELLLHCYARLEKLRRDCALLLVGDGLDRPRLEKMVTDLRLQNVTFTGSVAHSEMPEYVAALDVGVVLDPSGDGFHYSPLKLREYMAVGRPAIVPSSGEMARTIHHDREALMIPPANEDALLAALLRLHDDVPLRARLSRAGREHAQNTGSWTEALLQVQAALEHGVA